MSRRKKLLVFAMFLGSTLSLGFPAHAAIENHPFENTGNLLLCQYDTEFALSGCRVEDRDLRAIQPFHTHFTIKFLYSCRGPRLPIVFRTDTSLLTLAEPRDFSQVQEIEGLSFLQIGSPDSNEMSRLTVLPGCHLDIEQVDVRPSAATLSYWHFEGLALADALRASRDIARLSESLRRQLTWDDMQGSVYIRILAKYLRFQMTSSGLNSQEADEYLAWLGGKPTEMSEAKNVPSPSFLAQIEKLRFEQDGLGSLFTIYRRIRESTRHRYRFFHRPEALLLQAKTEQISISDFYYAEQEKQINKSRVFLKKLSEWRDIFSSKLKTLYIDLENSSRGESETKSQPDREL